MPRQTPQQFLLATPRGAYTTVYVKDRQLLNWPKHVERLEKSLSAMHTAIAGFYDAYYSSLAAAGRPESAVLQQLLGPPIREALAQESVVDEDLMLMIVMVPEPAQPCGLDVRVLAYPSGLAGSNSAGEAVILGGPRKIPVGKDSGWVAERQSLEQQKGEAVEVLLSAQDGRVLEGLVTNLFVVTGGSGSSDGPPVVWTAGMQDGVVWGTVRAAVLEACSQLGIEVREEAPSMDGRHVWREAFVTNGLRLVQPLRTISCGAGNVWGHPPWTLDLPHVPGPVTTALSAAVLARLPAVHPRDL